MSRIDKHPPRPQTPTTPSAAEEQPKTAASFVGLAGNKPLAVKSTEMVEKSQKVLEQQISEGQNIGGLPRKRSAQEMEQIAAQHAQVHQSKKKKSILQMDQEPPIALPTDDVDESVWQQQTIDTAEQSLTLQSSLLEIFTEQTAANNALGEPSRIDQFVEHLLKASPEAQQHFEMLYSQALSTTVADPLADAHMDLGLQEKLQKVLHQHGIVSEPTADALGVGLLRVACRVSGKSGSLEDLADGKPESLMHTVQEVIEDAQGAVAQAKQMTTGVQKQLSVHRTLIFKR